VGRRNSFYTYSNLEKNQAVALFTFKADQPSDLGFKKGDIITVTKKTDKAEDWWYAELIP
jgi:SH3 domain-containing YSC84-like protein 1